jgi:hypothetical protein
MKRYVINFPYIDDFDLPYVSFRINLDAPPERPFIQKALVKCLPGFGRADDLHKHAPATTGSSSPLANGVRQEVG